MSVPVPVVPSSAKGTGVQGHPDQGEQSLEGKEVSFERSDKRTLHLVGSWALGLLSAALGASFSADALGASVNPSKPQHNSPRTLDQHT